MVACLFKRLGLVNKFANMDMHKELLTDLLRAKIRNLRIRNFSFSILHPVKRFPSRIQKPEKGFHRGEEAGF